MLADSARPDVKHLREMADPGYRRDLGDGLVLRWSTGADADALAKMYGIVFRPSETAPLNIRAMAWARDMLSGNDPLIGPDGFALVEDTTTGEVVAATCLLREAWEYDGIRFPVGRPEIVGSLPTHRRRGLVREVMRLIHARSQHEGDLAQVITGISWYYRQFGYEYAVELPGDTRIASADIPALKDGETEPFTMRMATESDIPAIARLYDEERAGALVSAPIDAAYWHYAIVTADPEGDGFGRIFAVVDANDAVVGYAHVAVSLWDDALFVLGFWLRAGSWLSALPSVMRGLKRIGETSPQSRNNPKPCQAVTLQLPAGHPSRQALGAMIPLHTLENEYAWYVRVEDLPALMQTLAPALERRLAASPYAGYTGDLTLDFYRGGLRLSWRDGRLAEAADWQKPDYGERTSGFPPGVFLQLLFGYRDLSELMYAFPDVRAEGTAKALLPLLFPKRASWPLPLG